MEMWRQAVRNKTTSQQLCLSVCVCVCVWLCVCVCLGTGAPGVATGVCSTVGIVAAPVMIEKRRITFNRPEVPVAVVVLLGSCGSGYPKHNANKLLI